MGASVMNVILRSYSVFVVTPRGPSHNDGEGKFGRSKKSIFEIIDVQYFFNILKHAA
jgi:hypothetical protein